MAEENFQTASDVAYRIISQKILDGEFPPGMKLSRRKMAEATGVSVIPVIEALKRLEEDRLVESKPQWGSFVTIPTLEKIKQSYQLREAIECQSARILSQSMTPEQKVVLMEIATELDTVPYKEDTAIDSRNSHVLFHTKLTDFTNNHLLVDTLRKINLFWVLCKAIGTNAPKTAYPRYWHRYLVDEIAKGDPDTAERAMRQHVNDSLVTIIAAEEQK
ncbi:GntR family transcriptional regulator [Clostridium sp. MCC353]|uniref:GntR family transcriptional regulator n=1 Tax=Clostridium sp. MCC353 TaxID=2592646 RepID=UPI001C00EC17|nr:GntR family transcriptional regulator [Clostridium sp. MCC353]MBT9778051.1 GntR family transcriptional regulator [Clostridium sp. MCC353]